MLVTKLSVVFCLTLLKICDGIYTPGETNVNQQTYSSVKTSFKPSKPLVVHQNYSNVHVHNPSVTNQRYTRTLYVTSEDDNGFSQKYYPIYNAHAYGQRPGVIENVQKIQKFQVYNRFNNTREENIRSLQDTLEKLEQPNNKIITSFKRKKEIAKQIEVYSKCPPGVTGQFVSDLSCHQFLNCWKGRGFVQNCAPGTLFNPKTLECDYPDKVECITGFRQNAIKIKRDDIQQTQQAKCPASFVGMIPNYKDCSKFINCNNGFSSSMDCPPGTLFDTTKNMCEHAHLAICYNGENYRDITDNQLKSEKYTQHGHDQYQTTYGSYNQGQKGSGSGQYNSGSAYYQTTYGGSSNNRGRGNQYQGQNGNDGQYNAGIYQTTYEESSNNGGINGKLDFDSSGQSSNHNQETIGFQENTYHGGNNLLESQSSYDSSLGGSSQTSNGNTQYQHSTQFAGTGGNTQYSQTPNHFYNQHAQTGQGFNPSQTSGSTTYYSGNSQYSPSPTTNYEGQTISQIQTGSQAPTSGTNTYYSGNTQYSYSPNQGQTVSHGTNTYQTSTSGTHNSGSLSCPNPNGLFKHPSDCKKFLNCANGQVHVQDCAPGTVFNPAMGNCDFPYNVNCQNSGSSGGEFADTKITNTYQINSNHRQGQKLNSWDYNQQGGQTNTLQEVDNSHATSSANHPNWNGVVNIGYHTNKSIINPWNQGGVTPKPQPSIVVHSNWRSSTIRPVTDSYQRPADYDDMFDVNYKPKTTTARSISKFYPEPIPITDVNADYVFDNTMDYEEFEIGEVYDHKPKKDTMCQKNDFHCDSNICVAKTSVCDGKRDCSNGKDELNCQEFLDKFQVHRNKKLAIVEKQRWNNVNYITCAMLCLENDKFECRSFNYRKVDKTCFLSDLNIGLSGRLMHYEVCDYYELKSQTLDCANLHVCANKKCISNAQICDGFDDCGDRMDEKNCPSVDLGYEISLKGTDKQHQGRIEVKAFGKVGYICDDKFGLKEANVVCRELGFNLGAAEVKGNSFFAQDIHRNRTYLMDDVNCDGNESSIKDCGFSGWGMHNCMDKEIAGVVCKVPQEECSKEFWKCDTGNECIPNTFLCDGLYDCSDNSDEDPKTCDEPMKIRLVGPTANEGRVEVKHHGLWGTICDDDFNEDAAKVICKELGYVGSALVKKESYYGKGSGPIWLDQVYCYGNETNLVNCSHWNWGEHNCDHTEDVGVVCSNIDILEKHSNNKDSDNTVTEPIYPETCGSRKDNIFLLNDDVHFRVVQGSLAKPGDYPWQASIKVKTKTKPAHWCGAVVISSRFVLTAAHCLIGYSKGAYIVVAGDYNVDDMEGTEQTDFIEEFFIHDEFREGHKMNNDIALVKLKKGFKLNQDIQPICLPNEDTVYEPNLNCTISGFGSTDSGKSAYAHDLRAGWVPIQSDQVCKMPHIYGKNIMDGMFCAGFLEEGVDACDGDSGGPLACLNDGYFTLYGLTSWGQHCGYANKPGVYVKVAHYRKWIDKILNLA